MYWCLFTGVLCRNVWLLFVNTLLKPVPSFLFGASFVCLLFQLAILSFFCAVSARICKKIQAEGRVSADKHTVTHYFCKLVYEFMCCVLEKSCIVHVLKSTKPRVKTLSCYYSMFSPRPGPNRNKQPFIFPCVHIWEKITSSHKHTFCIHE